MVARKWNPEHSPLSYLTLDSGIAGFDEAAFLRSGLRDLQALSKEMCEPIIPLGPTLVGLPDAVKPAPHGALTGKGHQLRLPTRRPPDVEVTVENIDYVNGRRIR